MKRGEERKGGLRMEKKLKKMGGILLFTFFWLLLSGFAYAQEVVIKGRVSEYGNSEKGIEKVLVEVFPLKIGNFRPLSGGNQPQSRYFTYTDENGEYYLTVPVCDETQVCLPELSNNLEVRATKEGYRSQSAWLEDVKPGEEIEVNFVLEKLPTPTPEPTPEPTPTLGSDNQPPRAIIKANPTFGKAPLSVDFSGEESYDPDGKIVECLWNFGDGSFSNLSCAIEHVYKHQGHYNAQLTVKDNEGATNTAGTTIRVTTILLPIFEYSAIIKGKVTAAETGEPIVGAIVGTVDYGEEGEDWDNQIFARKTTQTDEEGNYELRLTWKGEPQRVFTLTAQANLFKEKKCYEGKTQEIEVEDGESYTLDFSLKKKDKCFNFRKFERDI
ncbi:MAG: PKD domain-containing protein, partial [Candidatus Omnitrophica bacterium]|nr:PKD domain-containing protein [Candidatus Omnitrophota bacterium]